MIISTKAKTIIIVFATIQLVLRYTINYMDRCIVLDYRIVNPDTPSYASQDWKTVLNQYANQKHQKYDHAV